MTTPSKARSLSTELLAKLAVLLTATLGLLATALVVPVLLPHRLMVLGFGLPSALLLFVVGAAIVLRRSVVEPLHHLARAANGIADGDLARRMPDTRVGELQEICAGVDRLTSRVQADQAQLVRAEKLASIGRLSASVAHEIGNPLGAILGHVHLLRRQLLRRSAPTSELELLAAMERESARIERIVRGLLDYARARPPLPSAVDVESVITSSVELIRSQGALKAVDVSLELTHEPLLVNGQRHDLEQLFVNLLVNAVDAMNGRGRIVVRLERAARFSLREPATRRSAEAAEGVIEHPPSSRVQRWLAGNDAAEILKIVVADSGSGIPAALAERVFDPFFTTKPPGQGTGLGLAIVARIVENFHGTIWVTGSREGGAAFHLLFPMVSVPVAQAPPRREGRRRPTTPIGRPRVAKR